MSTDACKVAATSLQCFCSVLLCELLYPQLQHSVGALCVVQLYPRVSKAFRKFLWQGMSPALAAALLSRSEGTFEELFNLLAPFALQNFNQEIQSYR